MKALVFSDSHGNVTHMKQAVERERPDRVFHLGDVVRDACALREAFPGLPMEHVSGNCDYYDSGAPEQLIAELCGKRLMLTHGHRYQVKLGVGAVIQAARRAGVDAVLFGHTHEALCVERDGLWVVNPGSIRGPHCPTYGVLLAENGGLTCHITEIERQR